MLTIKSELDEIVRIQQVHDGVCIQGKGGGEDDDFIPLAGFFQKIIDTRALLDIDGVNFALHLQRDLKIGAVNRRETAVNKGFIQVENKTDPVLGVWEWSRE